MKLCELIKYSSERLNKMLKALLSLYALFEINLRLFGRALVILLRKKPLSSFSPFLF